MVILHFCMEKYGDTFLVEVLRHTQLFSLMVGKVMRRLDPNLLG